LHAFYNSDSAIHQPTVTRLREFVERCEDSEDKDRNGRNSESSELRWKWTSLRIKIGHKFGSK